LYDIKKVEALIMQGFGAPKKRKRKKNNNINDDFIKLEEAEKKLLLQKAFKNHQEGKISVAEKYYQIFIDKGFKDQKVFISYGKVLEQKGQFKKAIEIWEKSIKFFPESYQAYYCLGNILLDIDELDKAENYILNAIELFPNLSEAYYTLGRILTKKDNFKEAENSFRKAIKIEPFFVGSYINLGNTLQKLGKLKQAEKSIRKAIEIQPDLALAYLNLGNVLNEIGNTNEAEESILKAIEIQPDFAAAYSNLGVMFIEFGKLKEAQELFKSAIKLDPSDSKNYFNLGKISRILEDYKNAEIYVRQAIELNPNFEEARLLSKEIIKSVDNLKQFTLPEDFELLRDKMPSLKELNKLFSDSNIETHETKKLCLALKNSDFFLSIVHKSKKLLYGFIRVTSDKGLNASLRDLSIKKIDNEKLLIGHLINSAINIIRRELPGCNISIVCSSITLEVVKDFDFKINHDGRKFMKIKLNSQN